MNLKPDNGAVFVDRFHDVGREKLIDLARKEKYFHNMRIAGLDTGSWVYGDNLPQNYHLFPTFQYLNEIDVSEAVCLDMGSFDGMMAFSLAGRGAGRVDATCQYDLDRFRIARALGGYRNVAYHPQTDLDKINTEFDSGQYDIVLMTAMLHHLLSPLEGFLEARRLLKVGGFLVVEVVVREGGRAQLQLNTALDDPVFGCPTLWIPSSDAVMEMLRFACLEPISRTLLIGGKNARESNYDRITVLAKAMLPSRMNWRTEKLKELHSKLPQVGRYRLADFEATHGVEAVITYSGPTGERFLNIWKDNPHDSLQPAWFERSPDRATLFKIGDNDDFCRLVNRVPDGAFTEEDLRFLPSRYTGQTMPEGMRWGLKQLGNLHVLDYIQTWGLEDILEIGPGFNLYFPNHLPRWCNYTGMDDEGFYEGAILRDADSSRGRGRRIAGLLGRGNHGLAPGSFDACVSVSVLEHVPPKDIDGFCREMYDLLRPGGWALHSIDIQKELMETLGHKWLVALKQSGFMINEESVPVDCACVNKPFTEPLSIVMTFYDGYKRSIWGNAEISARTPIFTILVAVRKPHG